MADLDDVKEGKDFGLGRAADGMGFYLKGCANYDWGMKNRMSRIFNPNTGRTVMLAFDHGYFQGPATGLERIDLSIVPLLEYADVLMCTRGVLRTSIPASTRAFRTFALSFPPSRRVGFNITRTLTPRPFAAITALRSVGSVNKNIRMFRLCVAPFIASRIALAVSSGRTISVCDITQTPKF